MVPPFDNSSEPSRVRPQSGEAGFTLIELLVTLGLVVAIMGAAVYSTGMITQADFKNEVRRMASAIKYTWSRAAVNNAQYRIVFDLDADSYRTEVTRAPVVEKSEDREAESSEYISEEAREAQEKEEESESGLGEDEEDSPFNVDRRPSYQEVKDSELKPHDLPGKIRIVEVIPCDREGTVTEGTAALHFYPNGFIQPAIIVLQQGEKGDYFSLQTEPLTGRVKIESKRLERTDSCGAPEEIQEEW